MGARRISAEIHMFFARADAVLVGRLQPWPQLHSGAAESGPVSAVSRHPGGVNLIPAHHKAFDDAECTANQQAKQTLP
jgi:hypothetical protein